MLKVVFLAVVISAVWLTVRQERRDKESLEDIEKRTRADLERLKAEMAAKAARQRAEKAKMEKNEGRS